ncbi:MAG: hypothetical protein HKP58_06540 [Desulfatitalea sp.]|nr:hypothetical protein [Desulfatitalea sp.]NNK00055.1 hypothetical protein [Desulfatitalea sp.]
MDDGRLTLINVARETVVRMTGMQGYNAEETEQIRNVIFQQTEAAIKGRVAHKGQST